MQTREIVKNLFDWNTRNLVKGSHLKKSEIGNYFADSFLVLANGKSYQTNHNNYFDFLNEFRASIRSITYQLGDLIIDKQSVVIPLKALIVRTDSSSENFEAILILKFNQENKIILWHEVYVKI